MTEPIGWGGGRRRTENYYDQNRNPTKIDKDGNHTPGAAALADTTQWTYTVPTGKKAFWELSYCRVINTTTIAVNGTVIARIEFTKSGGAAIRLLEAILIAGETGNRSQTVGQVGLLQAGDALAAVVNSGNSQAGTNVELRTAALLTEFDKGA